MIYRPFLQPPLTRREVISDFLAAVGTVAIGAGAIFILAFVL